LLEVVLHQNTESATVSGALAGSSIDARRLGQESHGIAFSFDLSQECAMIMAGQPTNDFVVVSFALRAPIAPVIVPGIRKTIALIAITAKGSAPTNAWTLARRKPGQRPELLQRLWRLC
jgi:hypothetical protein